MNRQERNAWASGEAVLRRLRATEHAAQNRAVRELQNAGFHVESVDEFEQMRRRHLRWERERADLTIHDVLDDPLRRVR